MSLMAFSDYLVRGFSKVFQRVSGQDKNLGTHKPSVLQYAGELLSHCAEIIDLEGNITNLFFT